MRLRKFINIGYVASILTICLCLSSSTLLAQQDSVATSQQDSTISSITTATDTAAVSGQSSSATLISTAVDTVARYQNMQPEVAKTDFTEAYKSAAYYVMLFLLVCLFVALIDKVMDVYRLSNEMQGKKSRLDLRRLQATLLMIFLIAGLYGVYWSYTVQGAMSMEESASEHGVDIDMMFNITVIITTIVFILTHIALLGFSWKYRGADERKAYFYPHNNSLERIWTIVPAIVLTVLVLLGFFTWRSITNVTLDDQKKAINIEVIGEQFKWNLRYAGTDNVIGKRNFKLTTPTNGLGIDFTDQKSWDDKLTSEIVIPIGKPVRFTVGSKDILHSFYLPDFRVQINAVPGMPTYFQFTPRLTTAQMREKKGDPNYDYVLLCAKICGAGHYNMQAKVTVVSEAEYATWLAKQPLFYNDDVKREMQLAAENQGSEKTKIALTTNTITE